MKHNDCLKLATAMLRRNHIEYRIVQGRHIKLRFQHHGQKQMIIPRTPSDWRAIKNMRANLRRVGVE